MSHGLVLQSLLFNLSNSYGIYIKYKFRVLYRKFTSQTHLLWEHNSLQDSVCLFKRKHVKKSTPRGKRCGRRQCVFVTVSVCVYLSSYDPLLPWNLCRHSRKRRLSLMWGRPHTAHQEPTHMSLWSQTAAQFPFGSPGGSPLEPRNHISRAGSSLTCDRNSLSCLMFPSSSFSHPSSAGQEGLGFGPPESFLCKTHITSLSHHLANIVPTKYQFPYLNSM